jgi:peroxiredoxin
VVAAGESAPDLALLDQRGEERRLVDALAVGPVVLAFFKADCSACSLAFPYLERLRQAYPADGWTIWGISQHPARAAEWFARNTGLTFPLLIDADDLAASRAYDPPATPTIYLLDRDGSVRADHHGFSKDALNGLSEQLAAELGVAPAVVAPPDDGKPSFRPG